MPHLTHGQAIALRCLVLFLFPPEEPQTQVCKPHQEWKGPDRHQWLHGVRFTQQDPEGRATGTDPHRDHTTPQVGVRRSRWLADPVQDLGCQLLSFLDGAAQGLLDLSTATEPESAKKTSILKNYVTIESSS